MHRKTDRNEIKNRIKIFTNFNAIKHQGNSDNNKVERTLVERNPEREVSSTP